jgi:hypothetical protein
MKYFCSKCGKTTQYNFELPKFCAFCGQSFSNNSAPAKSEIQRNKFLNELKLKKNINSANKEIEEDIQDLDADLLESSNVDFKKIKPSFKLDIYKNKGESFGSLIDNPAEPGGSIDIEKKSNKTKEDILAEFQREAGALRTE